MPARDRSKKSKRKPPRDPLQVNLRRLVYLILLTVILPTAVVTGIGIAVIVARKGALDLVFGVLVISFASSVIAGAVLLLLMARRGARLARMQETFLSHIGHELLTPLAGIRLHSQILSASDLPEDARASALAIRKESERLQTLVERTMRWRKIRSTGHLYEKASTSLQQIISRVRSIVPDTQPVSVHVRDPQARVLADRDALAEAVANLVQNAAKYGGHEPVELIARKFAGRAVFMVRDRGPGLPPGELERLFEPFYRHVPEQQPDPGGTGLGLAIARQIARAHGGHLTAANRRGRGARFAIVVPLESA